MDGLMAEMDATMNSTRKILKKNARLSVHDLKLRDTWVMDNEPKDSSNSTWMVKKTPNEYFAVAC